MTNRIFRPFLVTFTLLASALAGAAIPVGTLAHDGPATPEQLSLILPVTGSLPNTATATLRYRPSGSPNWIDGHPMFRIRPDHTDFSGRANGVTVTDDFAWPIIDLVPGTSYEVEVTVTNGAETETRAGTFTTRALPPAAGAPTVIIPAGASPAQIESAIEGAGPGDVVQFENGTYNLGGASLRFGANGSASQPLYVRGESRDGVILTNGSPRALYFVRASAHAVFENMTLQGLGEDRGVTASSAIQIFGDTSGMTNLTFRNMTVVGHDKVFKADSRLESFLIYDNTFVGNNDWEQDLYAYGGSGSPGSGDGTPDVSQNLFWNDDGVSIPGIGHAVFNNTFRGFGDSLSFCSHAGNDATAECRNIHFYRNDVYESGDDCAELDYAFRNVTLYDNRCTNGMTAASLDNGYGGPFLIARNIFTNIGRNAFKFNGTISGQFVYNNTLTITDTKDNHGWVQFNNGAIRSWGYRNNVYVYLNAQGSTYINEAGGHDPIDFTHNSWYPDSSNWAWNNSGSSYSGLASAFANLPATTPIFSAQTRRHFQDNILSGQPYVQPLALGTSYLQRFDDVPLPVLSSGSNASGNGIAIANITDGFSGGAPDRGALITGRAQAAYGDRTQAATPRPVISLSATPTTVNSGETAVLTWSSTDATSCTASGGWSGARATSNGAGETTPPLSTTTEFILSCSGPGGSDSQSVTVTVFNPTPSPTVSLTATPTTVVAGETTLLTWTSTDADSCTASSGWTGSRPTSNASGETSEPLNATTTFELTCTGAGGSDSDSATVNVTNPVPPPTVSLAANPDVVSSGETSLLSWSTTDADVCAANGGWSGSRPTNNASGETSPALSVTTTFILTCTGPGGTAEDSVTVSVNNPAPLPTVSLNANPAAVTSGDTTLLSWSSTDADSCTASGGWSGSRPTNNASGETSPALSVDTTFTLSCIGAGGTAFTSVTVSVDAGGVPDPVVNLSAAAESINNGDNVVLSWAPENAVFCQASGGWEGRQDPAGGSLTVGPLLTNSSFSLTCTNSVGVIASETVNVAVTNSGNPPTMGLVANPAIVVAGASTVLSWSSSNATSCEASGSWSGARPTSGTELRENITQNQSYILTCTGPNGSVAETAAVMVIPNLAQPAVNLTATPTTIDEGGSVELSWNSTSTTSCEASGSWSGARPTSGSEVRDNLTQSQSYTITCTGPDGNAGDTVAVTVISNPGSATVTLSASPTTVDEGGSVELSWSSSNTTSCEAGGDWSGAKATSGTETIDNLTGDQTYTLDCTGPDGSASNSTTVTVTASVPAPTVTLTASPTTVDSGDTTTLSWSSTNAQTCVASAGWSGVKATGGSEAVTVTADTFYTIECTNATSSASATVGVTVNAATGNPPPSPPSGDSSSGGGAPSPWMLLSLSLAYGWRRRRLRAG